MFYDEEILKKHGKEIKMFTYYLPVKGNNPHSSFFSKTLSIIFTIQFFILFSETLITSQANSWVSQNNMNYLTQDASLSEPYSTVSRQPIIFKLLRVRADCPLPGNRRSGTRRLASNFLASCEFLRCKFKFLRGVSEFSRAD